MGKHNTKNGVAQNRSRARSLHGFRGTLAASRGPKNMYRPAKRLEARIKFFDEVESKCTKTNHDHHRPGSMKARTN